MNKVTLICPTYQDQDKWANVERSVRGNLDSIDSLIVVEDDISDWKPPEKIDSVPVRFLSQEHKGFGAGRARNLAAKAATTPYICFTQPNMFIHPGSIKANLSRCAPNLLIGGLIEEWIGEERVGADRRLQESTTQSRHYSWARTGYLFADRQAFLDLGGFDEQYEQWGRGFEDWDLGARWLLKHGLDSIRLGAGWASHFSQPLSQEKYLMRMPHYEARAKFARQLLPLFDYRIALFSHRRTDNRPIDRLNVEHVHGTGGHVDIRLDCLDLGWLEDESISSVWVDLPTTLLPESSIQRFLDKLVHRLKPGADLTLEFVERPPLDSKRIASILEMNKFWQPDPEIMTQDGWCILKAYRKSA